MFGDTIALGVAASLDFECDVLRNIFRPMLRGVERNDADRVTELAGNQVHYDRFEIRLLDLGFPVDRTQRTKTVDDKVDGLVGAAGHRIRCTHNPTPNTMNTVLEKAYLGRRVLARGHATLDCANLAERESRVDHRRGVIGGHRLADKIAISVSIVGIWAVAAAATLNTIPTDSPGRLQEFAG